MKKKLRKKHKVLDHPSEDTRAIKKSKKLKHDDALKVATPHSKLRVPRAKRNPQEPEEEWARIMCVIPQGVEPLWDRVQEIMKYYGIEHPNKAVENGMHLEMLIADFLAGVRVPGYLDTDPYDP